MYLIWVYLYNTKDKIIFNIFLPNNWNENAIVQNPLFIVVVNHLLEI